MCIFALDKDFFFNVYVSKALVKGMVYSSRQWCVPVGNYLFLWALVCSCRQCLGSVGNGVFLWAMAGSCG